ncbi:hypothetical protein BUALT_Bualt06G0146700 [Buddleja alternifolia]|uniref:WEB family protein n=1 Tax=Buddleja alternifolia TaxID=168488 RepID=A0AAV6XJI1_9LAMI|nr:hypothetical protein BUALT_Bualt06G0146700 [Buddleja alternifolia]
MSTKSKSALSGTPNTTNASPATPRVSKLNRGLPKSDSDSRASVDRSPSSVTSKSTADRPSPRLSTPPDKKTSRILKPSELQAELTLAQEDLKKAKQKLVSVEKEKAKAVDDLKEARRSSDEANEKLSEALVAQKRAEEDYEIQMFRAVEIEQAGIEATEKKEDEWLAELEAVRNQHAVDVAALLSATQELQKLKQELVMTFDAKNQALSHAEDATKIAEIQAEKVAAFSAELVHLKVSLDSRIELEANENNKFMSELKLEIDSLRQELEKAKKFEEKLEEKEATLEQLNVDLEAAKMAESYAHNLLVELDKRVEELAFQAEQAKRLEKCASESLESAMKQLEVSKDSLRKAEYEIATLEEKAGLLETSMGRQKADLEESQDNLELAKEETSQMVKKIEFLKCELETLKDEKTQAFNNEKLAAARVQTLLEERNKLINELETSRDEEEKSKKALESLVSSLHEVSTEARGAKEKLFSIQAEHENCETQIQDLKLVFKITNEKYESMLDDAKQEIDALTCSLEQSKHDHENLKAEWEQKELQLMNSVKSSEEKSSSIENETSRLFNLLKLAEEEACVIREEGGRWKNSFEEAESEVIYLKGIVDESNAETMRLKEGLKDRENELHHIHVENEELQKREVASLKKVEKLSKLLEEALAKKQEEGKRELTDSVKEYDMLPKLLESSEQNVTGDVKPKVVEEPAEVNDIDESVQRDSEVDNSYGKLINNKENEKDSEKSAEVDLKMSENCKIDEQEQEQESIEDEEDSITEGGEGRGQVNGGVPSRENLDNGGSSLPSQKKKTPLLHKFGSLLKKKGKYQS